MRKLLFIVSLYFLAFAGFSQQVVFSDNVKNSQDENINQISVLWQNYIYKIQTQADSAKILYWNSAEINSKFEDIVRFNWGGGNDGVYYRFTETYVYNIKPSTNKDFYEINCISIMKQNEKASDIFAVYRVCATKEKNEFKLYNYFYTIQNTLQHFHTNEIEYFYPCNFKFDENKAKKSAEFLKNIRKQYNLPQTRPVIYIVANSIDECNELLGFHFSIVSSPFANAGTFRYPNIVIAAKIDHKHELIHSVFDDIFQNVHSILREGIATYYGGNSDVPFSDLKRRIIEDFAKNSEINLSDFDSYNKILSDGTNPIYTVGALIIEYALKIGGEQKVLQLAEYTNMDDLFLNEFSVKKENIHSFLLQLINQ
jgi:hypothetical protein